MRLSIDRPDVFIEVDALKYPQARMEDLLWILPQRYTCPQSIPKTIFYFEKIALLINACRKLKARMMELAYPQEALGLIRPYYSWLNSTDKDSTANAFKLPNIECHQVRILCATDAYGLGVHNPDVEIVVQWLLPSDLEAVLQKLGRAKREKTSGNGRYLLLYPTWCKDPNAHITNTPSQSSEGSDLDAETSALASSQSPTKKKRRKGIQSDNDIERRKQVDPNIYQFINTPVCYRQTILKHFNDISDDISHSELCCNLCDPNNSLDRTIFQMETKKLEGDTLMFPWILHQLKEWRAEAYRYWIGTDFRFPSNPTAYLSDDMLQKIAKAGTSIIDRSTLQRVCEGSTQVSINTDAILAIIDQARKHGKPKQFNKRDSEGFRHWEQYNAKSRRNKGKSFAIMEEISEEARAVKAQQEQKQEWLENKGFATKRKAVPKIHQRSQAPKRQCLSTIDEPQGSLSNDIQTETPVLRLNSQQLFPQSSPQRHRQQPLRKPQQELAQKSLLQRTSREMSEDSPQEMAQLKEITSSNIKTRSFRNRK